MGGGSGHPFPDLSLDSVPLLSKNLNGCLEMLPRLSGFHEHSKALPVTQTMRHETISRSHGDQTGRHCVKLMCKRSEQALCGANVQEAGNKSLLRVSVLRYCCPRL